MLLVELLQKVKDYYQEKNIASCRYCALDKVVAFIAENNPEVVKDISLLNNINKKQLKHEYEQSKGININGAEKQAINDLYNKL